MMWSNRRYSGSSRGSGTPSPPPPTTIMNKFMDQFYGQPPCAYYLTTFYDYLVVIDFEATCEDNTGHETPGPIRHERPEIIQFPAILVNTRTMQVEAIFDQLVKPVETPILSDFCTRLTGITQSMVKKAPTFPAVLRHFERWLKSYGLALNSRDYGHSFAIVTDGSYDMGHFLYKQCIISQIPYPAYAYRWVNIGTIFSSVYRRRWGCLKNAMLSLGMTFEGRAHNGLDDAKNICKVLLQFLRTGCVVYQTEKIALQAGEQKKNEARILNDKSAGKYDLATVTPICTKQYEHICVYSNDVWSTQRAVPPQMIDYEYRFESSNEPNSTSISQQQYPLGYQPQASTSGSCESIASGCSSNKENSIPIYIPNQKGGSSSGKCRMATSPVNGNDVICVSAAGVGSGSGAGNGGASGPIVRLGRKKKRNGQLKDTNGNSNLDENSMSNIETHDGVIVVSASIVSSSDTDMNSASSSEEDSPRHSHHHDDHDQSDSLESLESDDGDSSTHPRILSQMG